MRSLVAHVLGVSAVIRSIEKTLCMAWSTIAAGYCWLMKKERISIHLLKKSLPSLQRRLKRKNCVKGIELRVFLECEDEYSKYENQ